jgi:hypothetical protein
MLAWKTLLVPTDFSVGARVAVAMAADLARKFGATLVLQHVSELPRGLEPEHTIYPEGSVEPVAIEAFLRMSAMQHLEHDACRSEGSVGAPAGRSRRAVEVHPPGGRERRRGPHRHGHPRPDRAPSPAARQHRREGPARLSSDCPCRSGCSSRTCCATRTGAWSSASTSTPSSTGTPRPPQPGDRLPPRPRPPPGLHRRPRRRRPRRHARGVRQDGRRRQRINPLEMVDLVIDHSVQIDKFGAASVPARQRAPRVRAQPRALRVPQAGASRRSRTSAPCRPGRASATR